MQLKQLFEADDAVSPVIGVILMVAITVILAAVIASFVLGLGDQVSSTTPTASFSTEFNENSSTGAGNLTATHNGGDSIKSASVSVRGQNGSSGTINANWTYISGGSASDIARSTGSNSTTIQGDPAIAAGDFVRFPVQSDAELRIVFDGQSGDNTATLATFQGPDA